MRMHSFLLALSPLSQLLLVNCVFASGMLLPACSKSVQSAPETSVDRAGAGSGASGMPGSRNDGRPGVGNPAAAGNVGLAASTGGMGVPAAVGSSGAGRASASTDAGIRPSLDAGSGTGGTNSSSTDISDSGPASPDAGSSAPGDLCHLEGYDVGILGDSYINLSGDFTRILQETARAAHALDQDETYVDRSQSGASMLGDFNIPSQFPEAVAESKTRGGNGIKVVIMDGGGNDVLVDNRQCLDPTSVAEVEKDMSCVKVVDDTLSAAQKLFDDAFAEGVQATIFFFYPHLPMDSFGGGPNANHILDYSAPRAKELCDKQTRAPCYFVDMRAPFDDPANPGFPRAGLIEWDGIHPTLEGSKILAAEVWKVMQNKCIGVK